MEIGGYYIDVNINNNQKQSCVDYLMKYKNPEDDIKISLNVSNGTGKKCEYNPTY